MSELHLQTQPYQFLGSSVSQCLFLSQKEWHNGTRAYAISVTSVSVDYFRSRIEWICFNSHYGCDLTLTHFVEEFHNSRWTQRGKWALTFHRKRFIISICLFWLVFVCLTQTSTSLQRGYLNMTSIRMSSCDFLWDIFLICRWCRGLPHCGWCYPIQVSLGYIRQVVKQAIGGKAFSSILLWCLLQLLRVGFFLSLALTFFDAEP